MRLVRPESLRRLQAGSTVAATLVWLAVLCLPPAAAAEQPSSDRRLEPVPLRTVSPLRLIFFQLAPEGAGTLRHGESVFGVDLSESNVLHIRNLPPSEFDAEINLEITRVNLRYRRGLSDKLDLGVELPLYQYHTGLLDGSIRSVEDSLGDLKVQRAFERESPANALFRFQLKRDGETFFELPGPRSGLGDLAITLKRIVLAQSGRRPAFAWRAALELPTGDKDYLMGSGDVDVSVGVASDYRWPRWAVHGNLNATFPFGGPFEDVGLNTPPMISGHVGGAYRLSTWALHFQLAGTTKPFELARVREPSPLPSDSFENFGGSIIDGTLGASRPLGSRGQLWLAIVEDVLNSTNAASDVSLLVSVIQRSR
ncbi:MAG: DUF3187 family protein [bacterium]|nr:DUF3187 family protein [bacterium]